MQPKEHFWMEEVLNIFKKSVENYLEIEETPSTEFQYFGFLLNCSL